MISTISVIIPMYNSQSTIIKAIESVTNQTYKHILEIIIINDGSTDNSLETVQKYVKIKKLFNLVKIIDKVNGGVSSARNAGMKIAKGDFVAFLDSDDEWHKDKLEKQMKIFSEDINVGLVGSNINGNRINYFYWKKFGDETEITFYNQLFKNFFPTPTVIIKKEVIDKIGYFDETKRYAEDTEYFLRLTYGKKAILLKEPLVLCDGGKPVYGFSGLSANLCQMEKEELKNFYFLYNEKKISFVLYVVVVLYSFSKYLRRIIIVKSRKLS